ncbi:MAG TPA: TlpA disulfide reductase family protein [Beijerinckiaceae bacterium]|nr:TlpA disulfide reductase family protein [Beijerinckiaceae bacterium]
MHTHPDPAPPATTRSGLLIAGGLLVAVVAGIAGLYGMRGDGANSHIGGDCAPARGVAARIAPLATGEVAALKVTPQPRPAVDLGFLRPDGTPARLADWRGKTVLVNLWATWCAPCRAEMPALDRLQKALGGADFEVVTINIDTNRLDRPKAFLNEVGVAALAYYSDPTAAVFADLKKAGKAFGMPTTLLIDQNGCELGAMAGPAEWSSPDALALLRATLGR